MGDNWYVYAFYVRITLKSVFKCNKMLSEFQLFGHITSEPICLYIYI